MSQVSFTDDMARLQRSAAQCRDMVVRRGVVVQAFWSSVVWHSSDPARMKRVLAAWDAHAPYPNLPVTLAAQIRKMDMPPIRQTPAPVVVDKNLIPQAEADAWLQEFPALERQKAYFFCYTPILTEALRFA